MNEMEALLGQTITTLSDYRYDTFRHNEIMEEYFEPEGAHPDETLWMTFGHWLDISCCHSDDDSDVSDRSEVEETGVNLLSHMESEDVE